MVTTDPAANARNVAFNKTVAITFNEGMNSTTLNTTTFTLTRLGGSAVVGVVTSSGVTASFNPTADLAPNATYTARLATGVADLAGNALAADYIWEFSTGAAPDVLAPTVTLTDPAGGDTNVPFNKIIAATFSENMDAITLTTSSFKVIRSDGAVLLGTINYAGKIANFTPSTALAANSTYTATIVNTVEDLAGNPMASDYIWSFSTGAAPDATSPVVISTDPVDNATNVAFNKTVAVTFSESMNSTTINAATFSLKKQADGSAVTGVVAYDGLTASFNPAADLAPDTTYTATLNNGAKDLAGNPLTAAQWNFKTGLAPDITPPEVLSSVPISNATNVAITSKMAVNFNEAMDSGTINTASFKVTKLGGAVITGTVSYSGRIATFTPSISLAYNSTYTATIINTVEDLAGNTLVANYDWTFSTGMAPDISPPEVTSHDPVINATGVAFDKTVSVSFSETMLATSITGNLTLKKTGAMTTVAGVVSYSGLTAQFNPDADLEADSTYTATVNSGVAGVKDLAGNALEENYTWDFKTGPAPDTTRPIVSLTDPGDGVSDVPLNKLVKATFNEAMDASTISNISFKVAGVAGTVTFDTVTRTATFKPAANFAINTTYTATIVATVKDLAGNTMATDKVWSFTTGSRVLASPVALGAASPFGNFGGSAGTTNMGIFTVINGDLGTTGASTIITGFHDDGGRIYTETPLNIGRVTGTIYSASAPPGSVPGETSAAGAFDANAAYVSLLPSSLPGGIDVAIYGAPPGDLGNLTLYPGIYKSAPGSYKIQGGPLTLDAQGDANAIWVFQMASSLIVGGPGAALPQSVILANGAQAKNVFWQVGSAATINAGGGGTMVGTIISQAGTTVSTAGNVVIVTINGRLLSLGASITLVNTVINVPVD